MMEAILSDQLVSRSFQFEDAEGHLLGLLTFLPGGALAGSFHPAATSWAVADGKLQFLDAAGNITTVFNLLARRGAGMAYSGAFLPRGPQIWHHLTEIPPPGEAMAMDQMAILEEILSQLYGGDSPLHYADPNHQDQGYPHTNLVPEVARTVLELIRPKFWLELGSMLGGSAIRVADAIKSMGMQTEILCIDPFTGDVNMWAWEQPDRNAGKWQFLRLERGRPSIYDRFLANVAAAGHADVILPIAATSIVGIKLLRRLNDENRLSALPEVIYLDSAHEPGETFLELVNCWNLLPAGGVLIGDDWSWEAVRQDLLAFERTIEIDAAARQRFLDHHPGFSQESGILLDRGQWLLVK